jgi:2-polyprenyl-3-methyl-5-hydroxy-6-metoxy-1,4-benzoquinol methylase
MVAIIPSTHGKISWVTQLVVHTDFQNKKIGSRILHSAWVVSSNYAWGIASANPYAIRALEKATRHRAKPDYILNRMGTVKTIIKVVPYLDNALACITPYKSIIDTHFFQDMSFIDERIERASEQENWRLGRLQPGQEWLALVFRQQKKIQLTDDERARFFDDADAIVRDAYERMPQKTQSWARQSYAKNEVAELINFAKLSDGASVLDFGCGTGRHAHIFANLGYRVVGIDSSETQINEAISCAKNDNISFNVADCRSVKLNKLFDFGICLYDVVGSFVDDMHNISIIKNLIDHVKPGGYISISVMSYEFTENKLNNYRLMPVGSCSLR